MKKLLLFLGLSLAAFYSSASIVSEKTATTVAHNFITEKAVFTSKTEIVLTLKEIKTKAEIPFYYRYDMGSKGFIIIAASDLAHPILAYSFDEIFVEHPGMKYILSDYTVQIEAMEKSKAIQNSKIAQLWAHYSADDFVPGSSKGASLKPLIHTRWNQNKFYNTYCPWDASADASYDYRVPNGCVALAAAQLMFYYRHPESGTGGVSYTPAPYPRQMVQFNRARYNWDAMTNEPQSYTNEIAKIIYHVGVAVQMGYAPDGSGAYTHLAAQRLNEFFKYGNTYRQICRGENQGDSSSYANMLREYLDGRHPILYSGYSSSGGHAFLLDGYDENGLFHVNWGWGGSGNGYHHIDYLAPGNVGSGFDNNSCAILDLQPNLGLYNTACNSLKRLTATSGSISSGAPFKNYAPQPDCSWMIAAPYANQYKFTFNTMNTTPNVDMVTIYKGSDESAGIAAQFSGDSMPPAAIVVNADSVLITFKGPATFNSQYKGFSIDYSSTSNTPRCINSTTISDSYIIIAPETVNGQYLPNMNCTWLLRPQYTKGFSFTFFRFDLAEGDFVEVYNATTTPPTLYDRYDLNNLPTGTYTTNFNKANIKFISDNYQQKSGFDLLQQVIAGLDDEVVNNLRVYPNPAHDKIAISGETVGNKSITCSLFDISGKLLQKMDVSNENAHLNCQMDVSALASGFYLLHITSENGKIVKKITIQ